MRRVVCREFGPLERLQLEEAETPHAGVGEVVVAVRAAGVNFVDALLAQGLYQIKPPLPFTPGGEVAGEVAEVGAGVTRVRRGDRVLVVCGVGGFSTHLSAPESLVRTLPGSISFAQGAVIVQSYATALFALTRRIALRAGESILVLGAGGGIGLAAVDVARHLGARVIAAASSADKLAAASARGASATIDYEREDLKVRARALGGGGVDVVYDPIGGTHAQSALRALRPFGRYLVVGFASGSIPSLPANHVLLTNRSVIGIDWGAWSMQHHDENFALLDELLGLVAAGSLQPPEPSTYPLVQAAEALAALQSRRAVGKIALIP